MSQIFDFQVLIISLASFRMFQKFAKKVASQGIPPVSTTPASELTTAVFTGGKFTGGCVVKAAVKFFSEIYRCDAGGKLATSDNFAGGNFAAGASDRSSIISLLHCLQFNVKGAQA